jgi:hypothetical protein
MKPVAGMVPEAPKRQGWMAGIMKVIR